MQCEGEDCLEQRERCCRTRYPIYSNPVRHASGKLTEFYRPELPNCNGPFTDHTHNKHKSSARLCPAARDPAWSIRTQGLHRLITIDLLILPCKTEEYTRTPTHVGTPPTPNIRAPSATTGPLITPSSSSRLHNSSRSSKSKKLAELRCGRINADIAVGSGTVTAWAFAANENGSIAARWAAEVA